MGRPRIPEPRSTRAEPLQSSGLVQQSNFTDRPFSFRLFHAQRKEICLLGDRGGMIPVPRRDRPRADGEREFAGAAEDNNYQERPCNDRVT